MLFECFGVPLAPGRREEIARIDVDGSRQLVERVGDGVDDRVAEDDGLFRVKLLAALLAQAAFTAFVERVVFLSAVKTDDREMRWSCGWSFIPGPQMMLSTVKSSDW